MKKSLTAFLLFALAIITPVLGQSINNPVINIPVPASQGGVGPYFSAYLSGNQTVTSGTNTKVQFNTKVVDSNSWYDNTTNFRYTPLQAGKYRVHVQVYCNGTTTTACSANIYKNGTSYATSLKQATAIANYTDNVEAIIVMNGTTDYIEGWIQNTGTGTSTALGVSAPISTWFEASFVGL